MGSKKHKKHKSDRWGRYESAQGGQGTDRPQLRLILKVGGASTPDPVDHGESSSGISHRQGIEEDSRQSSLFSLPGGSEKEKHKRKKEKKKKKNKDKDKEKKKHKHKDKKRKDNDESVAEGDESLRYEVITVQPSNPTQDSATGSNLSASLAARVQHTSPGAAPLRTSLRPRQERPALQKLLELLLPNLEQKDPRQFFAWPVTDSIAPNYSSIITKPMDFSTMKQKIEDNQYKTLQEFTDDFVLMCNNAMTYNQPDTVYYKAAKRLLHTGLRTLTVDKVRPYVPTISNYGELTVTHLGFEPLEESFQAFAIRQEQSAEGVESVDHEMETGFSSGGETTVETARDSFLKIESPNKNHFDALPDDMTPDEILEQANEAAQIAANKLGYQHSNAKMGFLRQRKDGTTSLAILTPCHPGTQPGTTEVPVTLGALTGKVQPGPGTGQLMGFREDRRNQVKPVKPLYYGPFGSYAPSYDSTFSNLTKEESDLVLSTYGEETGVPYAESILDFVRDCDYALHIADDLLNLMTHGEHSTVAKILEEKRRIHQQQILQRIEQEQLLQQQQQLFKSQQANDDAFNLNALRSLGDLGIDVSFLDSFEAQLKAEQRAREASQNCLDETGSFISTLERTQRERLSKTPPPHLSNIMPPSEFELQLVGKITEGIAYVAKQSTPSVVASVEGVRRAMGVSLDPFPMVLTTTVPRPPVTSEPDQRDIETLLQAETVMAAARSRQVPLLSKGLRLYGDSRGAGDIEIGPDPTFICPPNTPVAPHPEKCELYYTCYPGYPVTLWQCYSDYLFDLTYSGCNYPIEVDCGERKRPVTTNPVFTCPTTDGFYAIPGACSNSYYVCVENVPYVQVT
uniref:EOG090X04G3 n=1 Tax=Daphnia similis TaxID=35528 RepID=A0A4Y7LUG7_9CRUS|nr:EOG090X04G3 [Daphnia similis]SVE71614.1 EOG090X04G3 [Daphnia similis]SVE72246.1 EOG090X04G3 [Daphnia similis]